ncbi:MAG: hypothetical protein EZS28_016667 [Streblomastix strix]|uniref:Uncharacterized protein n=1 Tax=Streblomastix strix TaxID=222440 RepID=A0A5J4VZY4_9EUKA|nr:MAG: hypothetical protein EZS28_016667 [Streblomastix strix]
MNANMNKNLNFKIMEILNIETGSLYTTHLEQELRNSNISQSECQPQLITTPPELGQISGKVFVPIQRIQPTNNHDTRTNSDTPNHFTPQQELRKKADVALVTEDKSVKRSKGNKTSAGSKKQKQGFNSENQIEIEPDSETDQPDQLD